MEVSLSMSRAVAAVRVMTPALSDRPPAPTACRAARPALIALATAASTGASPASVVSTSESWARPPMTECAR